NLRASHASHFGTRRLRIDAKREDLADLFEREPEILRATDEPDAPDRVRRVLPIAGGPTWRLVDEPLTLVKADGLDADVRSSGDRTDGQSLHLLAPCDSLESSTPYPTTGSRLLLPESAKRECTQLFGELMHLRFERVSFSPYQS